MPRAPHLSLALLLAPWCVAAGVCLAAVDPATLERPEVTIPRLDRAPRLDEFLDMRPPADLEGRMAMVEGFVQQIPNDGQPSTQRTRVYMGYDDERLYFVFLAFDERPDKMRAHLSRREDQHGDEIVEVQLDTFNHRQRAFSFISNPLGVQWDAIWTEGQGFDDSWDTVWDSRGRVTDRGYVVLMEIPFKSLRFPPEEVQTWGIVLCRDIPRDNEGTFWPWISNRIEGRLNQAATLRGVKGISPGRNIWLIPYATSRRFRTLDESSESGYARDGFDPDAGLDAKFVFKDSLALDATLNPDFSQVESDQPQVTVNQRFEVFFPEKRPFFLENAGYFETPFDLLFTRRIADPRLGARLTGKVGKFSLGALLIDDEAPGERLPAGDPAHGERARFGVLRLSRDLSRQSSVGLLYTERRFAGDVNRVAGVDGRFRIGTNWDTRFQGVYSTAQAGDDSAYNLAFNRSGRMFNTHIHYQDVGPQFRAEAGYVPRTDIRDLHQSVSTTFHPDGGRLLAWGPVLFAQQIRDHRGTSLEWSFDPAMEWEFRGQTYLELFFNAGRERLRPEDTVGTEIDRTFSTPRAGVEFRTRFVDAVALEADLAVGDAVNYVPADGLPPSAAHELGGSLELTLRPLSRFRIETRYLLTRLTDATSGRRILLDQIVRSRFSWQFNTKLSLRAIVEWSQTRTDVELTRLEPKERLNGDLLLTYLINPWTAIYAGYNTDYQNLAWVDDGGGRRLVRKEGDLLNDSRQLFFKVSYLFRP